MNLPKKNEHIKRSRLQERRGARDYSGSQNSGSGNGWMRKADVRSETELIEFKTTTKSSYSLRSSELRHHFDYAILENRRPVFEIEFANDGITCVILDKDDYMALKEGEG